MYTYCKNHNPVDERKKELVEHGTTAFPVGVYYDELDENIIPWHWHDEMEAAILLEGKAMVAIGDDKYQLNAGEGFFVNAGILHAVYAPEGYTCRFHSLVFHPRLIGGSLDSVFYQNYVGLLIENRAMDHYLFREDIAWHRKAMSAIENAWGLCKKEPMGFEFEVRSALSRLVQLLCAHLPTEKKPAMTRAIRNGERIKKMLQYIHENYSEELSVGKIAASALISESECLRCFHITIGTTPIQYVKQYRVQKAAALLSSTNETAADIAFKCGFQDVSYFTKSFREIKGLSPLKYRKKGR